MEYGVVNERVVVAAQNFCGLIRGADKRGRVRHWRFRTPPSYVWRVLTLKLPKTPPSPTLTLLYPLSLISLADTPIPCLTYIYSTIYNQDGSFLNGCRPMQHFLPWWDDWCFGTGPPSIGGQKKKVQYKVHLYSGFHIHSGRRVGHRVSSRSLFFFFFFWGRPIIMKTSRNVSHYKF